MFYYFFFVSIFLAASNAQYNGYSRPINSPRNPSLRAWNPPIQPINRNSNPLPNNDLPHVFPNAPPTPTPANEIPESSTLIPNDNQQPPVEGEVSLEPNGEIPETNEEDTVCKQRFGFYGINSKCDIYIECRNYKAAEKLCPDGMYFNRNARWPEYPCGYPSDVPCIGRGTVQPAKPTTDCPHQFGFYPLGDRSHSPIERCSRYMMCSQGRGIVMNCPFGLAFNEAIGRCDWPEQIPACKDFLGFSCPLGENEQIPDIVQNYRYEPNNCKYFWSCELGRARLLSCDYGLAFDSASGRCVTEDLVNCNHEEHPHFENGLGEAEI